MAYFGQKWNRKCQCVGGCWMWRPLVHYFTHCCWDTYLWTHIYTNFLANSASAGVQIEPLLLLMNKVIQDVQWKWMKGQIKGIRVRLKKAGIGKCIHWALGYLRFIFTAFLLWSWYFGRCYGDTQQLHVVVFRTLCAIWIWCASMFI